MKVSLKISAQTRSVLGKQVDKLRKHGKIPAVLYGHNVASLPLELDKKEMLDLYSKSGENTLIELVVDNKPARTVLVHDAQHHFLKGDLEHVDFYEVKMTEKIKTHVPIKFVGESKAVKDLGGVLVKNISELEVESLPADLPPVFEVDISKLQTFENALTVADLGIDSAKVKVLAKPEDIIAKVSPPRSEEELKALEEKPVEEVSAVEGVVKEAPADSAEGEAGAEKETKKPAAAE
ncbi:MAG: 50S ribosomal protein L25 [Patescibacteria group bacterium]|nr:50S ribosomal protein L25 [Patescibacteria group bacterium]